MSQRRIKDKRITPQQLTTVTPLLATESRYRGSLGILPIGYYKGEARFWNLDLAVVQPLIWAEKQWTNDIVDTRNGEVKVTVPVGTAVGQSKSGEIEVPAGEVWYLCGHEIEIPQAGGLTAGDISVNFRVSSFPKVDDADKLYYDGSAKQYLTTGGAKVSGGGLTATQAEIAAGAIYDHKLLVAGLYQKITKVDQTSGDVTSTVEQQLQEVMRDFREADELNNELRLVGGDKLTLVVTVATAAIAGAAVDAYLRVWGRAGKLLVT